MIYVEILERELQNAGLEVSSQVRQRLASYCNELVRWNQRINLTGLSGLELVRRLVIEPIWIGRRLNMSGVLVDIGSGNGSPGIPLSLGCDLDFVHLIEIRVRRASFLRHLKATLDLPTVRIHQSRFEEVASQLGAVNWITLQGVLLTDNLLRAIREVEGTETCVVWITSDKTTSPMVPSAMFTSFWTGTRVLCFRLDHS